MILHICYLTTREIAAVVPEVQCSIRLLISDTSLRNTVSIFLLEEQYDYLLGQRVSA